MPTHGNKELNSRIIKISTIPIQPLVLFYLKTKKHELILNQYQNCDPYSIQNWQAAKRGLNCEKILIINTMFA
jgi:hypothetical protein